MCVCVCVRQLGLVLSFCAHTLSCALSSFCFFLSLFLFTDLSVAGLPAELKHITQRRKRKQP